MDPFSFIEAVDISGQIPSSFYSQMDSKKWNERKEALEIIEKCTATPKIKNADFSELVRTLKKTIAKDTNLVVMTSAAKCLCQLAQGLRKEFSPHASSCLPIIFEKFKEKKPNVISVLRDAADAVFVSTCIENAMEDIVLFLDNKNPQIKSEMALFLARVFARYPGQVLNKKTLRPLINALIKTLSDMDATVRDSSATAIGTAMKVTGETLLMTLLADVEPIKIAKIKECCEKAEIIKETQNTQAVAQAAPDAAQPLAVEANGDTDDVQEDEDAMYELLDAVDISNQISASFYAQMESKKWNERKEALDVVEKCTATPKIKNADFNELVRVLKKTIAKDTNLIVMTSAAKCLCQLAQGLRKEFSPHANSCLPIIFEKFKEKKPNVISVLRDASDAVFVSTCIENAMEDIVLFLDNKNPQIKSEMALFLARAFAKYPVQVVNKKTLRPIINSLIKTLSDMDATVRDSSAMAIGTAMKVTGEKLMMTLIADVEPIKIPKIKEFCDKAEVRRLPANAMSAMNSAAPPAPAPPPNASAPSRVSGVGLKQPNRSQTIKRPAPKAPPKPSATSTNHSSTSNNNASHYNDNNNHVGASNHNNNGVASSAAVKRAATIVKRSTVTRMPQLPVAPPPAQQQHQQQPAALTQSQQVNISSPNSISHRHSYLNPSQQTVQDVLVQVFTLTQTCTNLGMNVAVLKSLNDLASTIIDSYEPADMMCILSGLLNDSPPACIVEPIKEAMFRSMKSL